VDALSNYGLAFGLIIGALSAAFTFFNRQKYKTLITDIYQPGNDELRAQLATERQAKLDCEKAITEIKAKYDEQSKYVSKLENLNKRLPDFNDLSSVISNNHKEVMTVLQKRKK